ncbi:hypothetical protein F7725_009498 [Dissostichus mawsoni]|uniref:Uncharacterized protein n=1 Tax=Dissostichus mawsoni TaxID=36200 RepID=A0A7J5XL53_DISMA|nr:hypothetical protein F7725_009498 [Dissostichus mawsoni]
MVMVGNLCHVFIQIVFGPSKHGVALDHIYQEITLRKLRKESELQCCSASTISTERELFEHLGRHLKKHETSPNCNLSTNIYGTFAFHKSRKHTPHSLQDFKEDLLKRYASCSNTDDNSDVDVQDGELSITDDGQDNDVRDLPNVIENNLALLFLKLESTFNVPNS